MPRAENVISATVHLHLYGGAPAEVTVSAEPSGERGSMVVLLNGPTSNVNLAVHGRLSEIVEALERITGQARDQVDALLDAERAKRVAAARDEQAATA